jgi:hypothetical protein
MEQWPERLQTMVALMLASRGPAFVWWGPELTNRHNDASIPLLGARHPSAFGRHAGDVWREVWDDVGTRPPWCDLARRATDRARWSSA